jgi:acyl carrier protein
VATVFDKIKAMVVEQLGVDEKDVVPTASFVEDLGADSLDLVELIMSLEEAFSTPERKIEIPDEAAEKIVTIQDAIAFLKEQGIEEVTDSPKKPEVKGVEKARQTQEVKSVEKAKPSQNAGSSYFIPTCLNCNKPMEKVEDWQMGMQGGSCACTHCGEQHKYNIVSGVMTLERVSVPRGYAGPVKKEFHHR